MATLGMPDLRGQLGDRLFARVAGPEGARRRERVHATPGPRWFDEDAPIRRVHGDASMFVGGLRALLLQSLHPAAMAGVAAHSGFKGDPWGRLQRTSYFLAVTTFGTAEDAEAMVARIRTVHDRVRGTAEDGTPYAASDPHLLAWVHAAEIDSFLVAHQAYGRHRLDPVGCDRYVAETARVAEALGVVAPPRTCAELDAVLASYRPELRATRAAREAARFLLLQPPLPLLARGPYTAIAGTSVQLLPHWARRELGLPGLPWMEAALVRPVGRGVVGTIRWAMRPAS